MTTKAKKIIIILNLKKRYTFFGRESEGVPKIVHEKFF